MTIGERIKAARIKAKMTQQELADKLGISYVAISNWENDKRNAKRETLDRIAKVLGVSRQELEGGIEWADYDKASNTTKIADEVQIAELVERRYGKEAVEVLAHCQEISPAEWETLSHLIEDYARLDNADRMILFGRIMQIIESMLAQAKYSIV